MTQILVLLNDALHHRIAFQVYSARRLIAQHPNADERQALSDLADSILREVE